MADSLNIILVDDNGHDRFLAMRELRKEFTEARFASSSVIVARRQSALPVSDDERRLR